MSSPLSLNTIGASFFDSQDFLFKEGSVSSSMVLIATSFDVDL